jgi:integrase
MGLYRRKKSPYWWMVSVRHGLQARSTGVLVKGATVGQTKDLRRLADELYAQAIGDLVGCRAGLPGYRPSITFEKFSDWYETHVSSKKRGMEQEAEHLARLRAGFGSYPIAAVDRTLVTEWMTRRLQDLVPRTKRHVTPATVNREVDLLKSVLKAAVPKYLAASPIALMPRLSTVTPKRREMTADEERQLLEVMDPAERALLLCGVDALIRLSDILDLRREDFTDGRWLYVADPKDPQQSTPLRVPVSRRLALALEAVPVDAADPTYLFARYRKAKTARDRRGAVRQMLEAACQRAGLAYGKTRGGITFHWSTRRTGATRLIRDRKVDIKTVQRIGGWKRSDVVLDIYAETNDQALLSAVRPPELVRGPGRQAAKATPAKAALAPAAPRRRAAR